MGCVVVVLALLTPRLALFLVVVFSDFVGRAYDGWLWPLLGFFFMPLTTLAYAAAINWNDGSVSGGYFFMVLIAALVDLGALGGGRAAKRRRDRRHAASIP
jgi:hypothetical protein